MTGGARLLAGGILFVVAFLALWANSAYLWAFATPSLFYFANVAIHPALGLLAAVFAASWVRRHRPMTITVGLLTAVGLASLATGLIVLGQGAFGERRAMLLWHVGISTTLVALVVIAISRAIWSERGTAGARAVAFMVVVLTIATAWAVRTAAVHEQSRRAHFAS